MKAKTKVKKTKKGFVVLTLSVKEAKKLRDASDADVGWYNSTEPRLWEELYNTLDDALDGE